jgi:hypothetical protein
MTVTEIGKDLVALCRQGQFDTATARHYAPSIVSIEADGQTGSGIDAIIEKGNWWMENHEIHGVEVEGPFVAGDQFVVRFALDITPKATGTRMLAVEVGVYSIIDEKIVEEKFYDLNA